MAERPEKKKMRYDDSQMKKQSYFRLLKYSFRYKFRLAVGLIAGFIVGGSLFGSLMMLPQLMKSIDDPERVKKEQEKVRNLEKIINTLESKAREAKTAKEKQALIHDLVYPDKNKDRIAKEVMKMKEKAKNFGIDLPIEYRKGALAWLSGSQVVFSIPAEDEYGKMTWQFFSIFVLCFVFMWIIKNLFTYINRYYTRWVGTRVIADLRNEVFAKLMDQSLWFYGQTVNDVGQLITRCTNDTASIESAVANVIADLTRCPLEILACTCAIVIASYQNNNFALPLILFVGVPVCVLPIIMVGRRVRKIYKQAFRRIADVVSRMHEVFTCILIVKAYHTEEREIKRFKDVNRTYFRTVVSALKTELLMAPLMETVAVISTLIFLIYSYSQRVSVTELVQLLVPAFLAYQPIKKLAKVTNYVQKSMAAADRYFNLLDQDTNLPEKADAVEIDDFRDRIAFNNVIFSYNSQSDILDGVSFEIPRGHVVAVVGETGSGKTTIANLIARFYDVTNGSVTIDGIDVRDVKIASLRNLIGIVTQNSLLFNETVADNIAYGCSEVTREQIVEAAKQAHAHDFIISGKHANEYEAVVGEKGSNLSGGEQQRVSIARAILKNPPILILDEATSALDTVTERLVQDALNKLMKNRTVFAIAHRFSTIKHADMIIVLDKGKIIEKGTHNELLKKNGRYAHLYHTEYSIIEGT